MMCMSVRAVVTVVWAVAVMACGARAQCEGRWLGGSEQITPGLLGGVEAMLRLADGSLVVGGTFETTAGRVQVGHVARWNGASWSAIGGGVSDGPIGAAVVVRALAVLPNGDLIAGGRFGRAGGVAASNIARWDGQRWHAMGSGFAGVGSGSFTEVNALAVMPNGDVVAGGNFLTAGGVTVNGVARWNGVRWSALGAGFSGSLRVVNALLVRPDGELVAGGEFLTAGGVTVNRIARWNGTAWSGIGGGFNGTVNALALAANGELMAGGNFTNPGRVARWTGTTWSAIGGGISGSNHTVTTLLPLLNGDVAIGGRFTIGTGTQLRNIAVLRSGVWRPLPGLMSVIDVRVLLSLPGEQLLVGAGSVFTATGSLGGVGRWDGTAWSALGGLTSEVGARDLLNLPNGDIVATGQFVMADGVSLSPIGRWDGGSWAGFAPGVLLLPQALGLTADGGLLAAGLFRPGPASEELYVGRWNGTGWTLLGGAIRTRFGTGVPVVNAMRLMPNGNTVIGGDFALVGGVLLGSLAQWDGSAWSAVGSGLSGRVDDLAVLPSGEIVVAGDLQGFDPSNPQSSNAPLLRWDGTAWRRLLSFGGSAVTRGMGVAPDGSLYLGGRFRFSPEGPVTSVLRWDGLNLQSVGEPPVSDVTALTVLADGSVIAAGFETPHQAVSVVRAARWDGASWRLLGESLTGGEKSQVLAIATMPTGELVFGGDFSAAGGVPSQGIARWTDSGVPRVAQQPARRAGGDARTVMLTARCVSGYEFAGPVQYQWRRHGRAVVDGPGGAAPGGGLVSGSSGQLPSVENGMTATLRISFAESADVGAYDVVFSTACGSVVSAAVEVTLPACGLADVVAVGGRAPADGLLTGDDFVAFIAAFAQGEPLADVCGVGGGPVCVPDGLVTSDDFVAFVAAFAQGCP